MLMWRQCLEMEDCSVDEHKFDFYKKLGFSPLQISLNSATK